MSYPINNDAEFLLHLKKRAEASGISGVEISVFFTHQHQNETEPMVRFHVATGYYSLYGSIDGETSEQSIDEAIAKFRPKIAEKAKARARELRSQAEKLLAQADSIDSTELTLPPKP